MSRGRLCPKGAASPQLTTGSSRRDEVLYRRPYAVDWERLDLDTAMDMVADRVVETRRRRSGGCRVEPEPGVCPRCPALLAGSAATRFGVFEAGRASSQDPKYTVLPQRERLSEPHVA